MRLVALVSTVAYLGLEARSVEVQCQVAPGLPKFNMVGLPDKAVNESKERVHAALSAMGLALPPKRITINLSPADLPKEGSHYDLPVALALLAAMGVTDAEQLTEYVAVGELALDGRIIASPGVLLAAIHAAGAEKGLICPAAQGSEARWASGVPIVAAPDLISLLNHLKGTQQLPPPQPGEAEPLRRGPDLKQVKGQETAKRALEIAAAGGHNLLMIGPPGAGKSLLAACLPGILPPLTAAEALEVSMVASVSGTLEDGLSMAGTIWTFCCSVFWIRVSISRTAYIYSSIFLRSVAPRTPSRRLASPSTESRTLFSYFSWRARTTGSRSTSPLPKRRSKTARGRTSGGFGVDGVRHEMLLL